MTMDVQTWIEIALDAAGLPRNKTNTILMAEWIRKEARAIKNKAGTDFTWDALCNPLNMKWMADTNGAHGSHPSYPNLYVSALVWALAVNPPPNFPNADNPLKSRYPEIRAAMSNDLDHIKRQPWETVGKVKGKKYQPRYPDQYYWSMFIGLCPQSFENQSDKHYYDYNNELERNSGGNFPKFTGFFWYMNNNSDEERFTLRREVLSQAILANGRTWEGHGTGYYGLKNTDVRGMFNPDGQRDMAQGSSIRKKQFVTEFTGVSSKRGSFRVNGLDIANLWKNYVDGDKLAIVGKTVQQGSKVANSPEGDYKNLVDAFRQIVAREDIPQDIISPNASGNYEGTDGGTAFNIAFNGPQLDPTAMALFGTPRGFVTDEPIMGTIGNLATSTLRNFMSAPNGDFVCWFPDYFGMYGQMPTLNIYDIEIVDFSIYHDDTPIATHVAVAGDPYTLGAQTNLVQWMESNGIISVQMDEILQQLFNTDYDTVKDLLGPGGSKFLNRYGMRPRIEAVPMIRSHVTEFMYAWRTFMMTWAAQYTTSVHFTFMPELYPGMRVRLADHNIELYVQGVTHNGSRSSGFSTSAQLTCPIIRGADGKIKMMHYGFPYPG